MAVCEHCEKEAERDEAGLCPDCRTTDSIRALYTRRRDWTPAWEENLRRLTRRASLKLPLFTNEETP